MQDIHNQLPSGETSVLALIPAFNEAHNIQTTVAGAMLHLPVLVVDDGSPDETANLAESAGATILRQQPNQGKGTALQAGFRWAVKGDYNAVVTLDADGQHDPGEIPDFLKAFHSRQADLVIGVRDFSQMPLHRRLANSLGRLVFSWATGQAILDNQSGYRLIRRRLLLELLDASEPGFEFEMEMIATCLQKGYRLEWIPIRTIYAGESSHINNTQHVVNFLRVAWQTRRQRSALH